MIEIRSLHMKFGDKVIFDCYNKIFYDNKIYSILGKSGCGKSTLLRIIAGLQEPTYGSVMYNGERVRSWMSDIFMMHQHYTNFPWMTVLDNVLVPFKYNDGKVTTKEKHLAIEILERVGLVDYADMYPHELSGGMRQRVALARVLVSDPKVILMDEPLSALDPTTRTEMQNLVLEKHAETKNTIIMVTHDPEEAKRMSDELVNL